MNESLQPLYSLLAGKLGWLPALMGWMAALRVAFKFVSGAVQTRLSSKLAEIAGENDADEIGWIEGVLRQRWYRVLAFLVDLVCSVKLPSLAMFDAARAKAGNGPVRILAGTILPLLGVIGLMGLMGCSSTKLEQGGAYAPVITNSAGVVSLSMEPDYAFFVADSAFDLAVSSLDAAFTFERVNRAMLWQVSPQIKHGLDSIRPQAVQVKVDYATARAAYVANPVPANLSTLQAVLGKTQQLAGAAVAVLPKQ
jgi:hypothetical protein